MEIQIQRLLADKAIPINKEEKYSHFFKDNHIDFSYSFFFLKKNNTSSVLYTKYGKSLTKEEIIYNYSSRPIEVNTVNLHIGLFKDIIIMKRLKNKHYDILVGCVVGGEYLHKIKKKYKAAIEESKNHKFNILNTAYSITFKKSDISITDYFQEKIYIYIVITILYISFLIFLIYNYTRLERAAKNKIKLDIEKSAKKCRDLEDSNKKRLGKIKELELQNQIYENNIKYRTLLINEVYEHQEKAILLIKKYTESDKETNYLKVIKELLSLETRKNNLKSINFKSCLDQIIKTLDLDLKRRQLKLTITCKKDIIITTDITKLKVVLYNILKRAIKRTPQEETIKITVEMQDHRIILGIKDNGYSYNEEEITKLLADKNIYDSLALSTSDLHKLAEGINGSVEETLSNGDNTIEFGCNLNNVRSIRKKV